MKSQSDYDERDLENVLKRSRSKNWSALIKWLDEKGAQEAGLPMEEVESMREDLITIHNAAVPFTANAHEAFRLVHHSHQTQ